MFTVVLPEPPAAGVIPLESKRASPPASDNEDGMTTGRKKLRVRGEAESQSGLYVVTPAPACTAPRIVDDAVLTIIRELQNPTFPLMTRLKELKRVATLQWRRGNTRQSVVDVLSLGDPHCFSVDWCTRSKSVLPALCIQGAINSFQYSKERFFIISRIKDDVPGYVCLCDEENLLLEIRRTGFQRTAMDAIRLAVDTFLRHVPAQRSSKGKTIYPQKNFVCLNSSEEYLKFVFEGAKRAVVYERVRFDLARQKAELPKTMRSNLDSFFASIFANSPSEGTATAQSSGLDVLANAAMDGQPTAAAAASSSSSSSSSNAAAAAQAQQPEPSTTLMGGDASAAAAKEKKKAKAVSAPLQQVQQVLIQPPQQPLMIPQQAMMMAGQIMLPSIAMPGAQMIFGTPPPPANVVAANPAGAGPNLAQLMQAISNQQQQPQPQSQPAAAAAAGGAMAVVAQTSGPDGGGMVPQAQPQFLSPPTMWPMGGHTIFVLNVTNDQLNSVGQSFPGYFFTNPHANNPPQQQPPPQ